MKWILRSVIFAFAFFLPSLLIAQDTPFLKKYQTKTANNGLIDSVWEAYKSIDATYHCEEISKKNGKDSIGAHAVNNRTFDSLLRPALSNVFVGSNDLTKNATAASFTQDDKAGTLNLNYARLKNKSVWNFGAFSKSTDGIFGIYTGNSWSSDVGLTVGLSLPLKAGLFFDTDSCDQLIFKRRTNIISVVRDYRELSTYDTLELKKDSVRLQGELSNLLSFTGLAADYKKKTDTLQQIDSVLSLYRKVINSIEEKTGDEKVKYLNTHVDSLVTIWEQKNADIFTGYNIVWFTISSAISNNSISLNTDSLPALLKKDYTAKSLAKILIGAGINWQRNARFLQNLNGTVNLGLRNYLDHPSVKKPGLRYDSVNLKYQVYNNNDAYHAMYDDLKANIFTLEPSVSYSIFFTEEKQIGWNIRTDMRIPIRRPTEIKAIYPATFNFITGPLFRLKKDVSFSSGTVGLDIGFLDCPTNTVAWKYFAFKFNVGIPFNALIK